MKDLFGFPQSRQWTAAWLWCGEDAPVNSHGLFRREIAVEKPTTATLYISADSRYSLYLDGEFVNVGPPTSPLHLTYYDELPLQLEPGTHVLSIVVHFLGINEGARPGLIAELVDGDGTTLAATNRTWRCRLSDAWAVNSQCFDMNKLAPFQELLDGRKLPAGWLDPGFDDNDWSVATEYTRLTNCVPQAGPWSRLVPSDIPPMARRPLLPERVESVGEMTDLAARKRPGDLSISLSAGCRTLELARIENAEAFCTAESHVTLQCSTDHLDHVFDGIRCPVIVLDFGRVLTAHIRLDLEGAAGTIVNLGYAERLIDGEFNNAIEGFFADGYTLTEGRQVWQSQIWHAFRFLKIQVRDAFTPLVFHSLQAVESTYPYEERGQFASSDDTLTQTWEISRATLRLCSNEGMYDTPWREAAQWLGDVAAATVPAIYACFGDAAITGKFFRQSGSCSQVTGMLSNLSNSCRIDPGLNTIPDYSLWWLMGLWRHYEYTGEARWLHAFYPEATRIVRAHFSWLNKGGFIENMPYWVFIDWAPVDKRGACAAYNAIFAGALHAYVRMAVHVGDTFMADAARTVHDKLAAGFEQQFFDPARGVIADGRFEGALSETVSEHANAGAILWDLVKPATRDIIIEHLFAQPDPAQTVEAQPFFMVVVLNALDRAGRFDLCLKLIRDRWGKRMVDRGATSVYEEWGMNGSWRNGDYLGFMRTHSHAWSACPAEFLIRNLVGLEILEPGGKVVTVNPRQTDFDYDITYPLVPGNVRVQWKAGTLTVTPDPGIEVR